MNTKNILLAYATRYGSTKEVAETVAAELHKAGNKVDIQPAQDVKCLDGYEAVVLGAAIYSTRWHPEAHAFLVRHRQSLEKLPVVIFALGPLTGDETAMQNSRRQLDHDLANYPWLKAVTLKLFVGKMDPSKLDFFNRLFTTASDNRDWSVIRNWANALPAKL